MFGVAIDIALKVAVKGIYLLQGTFLNFKKPQFQTGLTKNPKMSKKCWNFHDFRLKNSQKWHFNLELWPSQQLHLSKRLRDY